MIKTNPILFSLLISVLMVFNTNPLKSQFQDMKFEYLTVENGLSNNIINCIYKDHKGYIWIGTSMGLNRYDGTNIKIFENKVDDSTSLPHNFVYSILEDNDKNLWICTQNGGVCVFNKESETFTSYKYNIKDKNSLSSNYTLSLFKDNRGNIWVSTYDGFNKWLPDIKGFRRYYIPSIDNKLLDNQINSIAQDSKGNLWLGGGSDAIWMFNPKNEIFIPYRNKEFPLTLGIRKIICSSKNDVIWIGTYDKGLFSFDTKKLIFERFDVNAKVTGTSKNAITSLTMEDENHLLIGIDQNGINRLDIEKKKFEYCIFQENRKNKLNNGSVNFIFKDSEGILWVGTFNGVNIYNPKKDRFINYKNSQYENSLVYDNVFRFYEDSQGLIWIGTDGGGVSVFNPINKSFKNFKYDASNPNSIGSNAVLSITEDNNQDIWLGCWGGGLNRFDRKTEKFYRYMPDLNNPKAISGLNIYELFTDNHGKIWVCCHNKGVDIFDINEGVIKKYKINPENPKSILYHTILRIKKRKDGKIVLMGYGWNGIKGSCIYDSINDRFQTIKELEGYDVREMLYDSQGNCWAGTFDQGIILIKTDGSIQRYHNSNGLPSNLISGIEEDKSGNIWISSGGGISQYLTKDKKFKHFNKNDGLQGNQFTNYANLKAKDGSFYFGGFNGFNVFNPNNIKTNDFIPSVFITEFQIFNKPVSVNTPNSPLKNNIIDTKSIELTYLQSVISFGFTAINYTYPEKAIYAYKMDGYDKEWNYTDASRRYATYTNLDPGEYAFMVKATNNDEVWSDIPTEIKIIITPPFWKSLWFKALLFIIIVGSALAFFLYRVNQLKYKQQVLNKRVEERTAELQHANIILEEQQGEILQQNEAILLQKEEIQVQVEILEKINSELEKLSIIASETDNAVLIMDGNFNIEWINSGFTKLYGYTLKEFISEKGPNLILVSGYQNITEITRLCADKKESVQYQANVITKENKSVWIQTTITPIIDISGKIKKFIAIDTNITELKKAELIIIEQNNELYELNSTKDKLFSIIAHDLKNPFSSILGFSALLIKNIDKYSKEKILKFAETINSAANQTFKLLENLLQWARLQQGILIANLQECNIKTIVQSEISLFTEMAKNKNITLINTVYSDVIIICDIEMCKTILRNLITNAIKFTEPGGSVSLVLKENESFVDIEVRDNGVGIPSEKMKQLFKIEKNISTRGTSDEAGTGLGLILCKELAEKQNGKISVESLEGKGTSFYFSLPHNKI